MLVVPLRAEQAGSRLRLRLRARDVSVALRQPDGISSHNVLAAVVASIDPAGLHEVFVTLQIGPTTVLARLTRDSVGTLELEPSRGVFALVKSAAFDHG